MENHEKISSHTHKEKKTQPGSGGDWNPPSLPDYSLLTTPTTTMTMMAMNHHNQTKKSIRKHSKRRQKFKNNQVNNSGDSDGGGSKMKIIVVTIAVVACMILLLTFHGASSSMTAAAPSPESSEESSQESSKESSDASSSSGKKTSDINIIKEASEKTALKISQDYHLMEIVPHDVTSFTQGLTYHNGYLYEGSGYEYKSRLFQHDPTNHMKTLHEQPVQPNHVFGEGITYYSYSDNNTNNNNDNNNEKLQLIHHRLIQLTYKDKIGIVYSLPNSSSSSSSSSLEQSQIIAKFTYQTITNEGWGITHIPETNEFYVSDGSDHLIVWDVHDIEAIIQHNYDRFDMIQVPLLHQQHQQHHHNHANHHHHNQEDTLILPLIPEKRRIPVTWDKPIIYNNNDQKKTITTQTISVNLINELEYVDFGSTIIPTTTSSSSSSSINNPECTHDDQSQSSSSSSSSSTSCSSTNNDSNNNDSNNKDPIFSSSSKRIMANIWYQDVLVRIHPLTGKIDRIYNLHDLYPLKQRQLDQSDCLNGIAIANDMSDDDKNTITTTTTTTTTTANDYVELWVTGKYWPFMYKIRLFD